MDERLAEQIEIRPATVSEKLIVRHLMQLHNHDLSEFEDTDVDEFGLFPYDYLDHFWTDPDRYPYLVRIVGKIAGFALLERETWDDGTRAMFVADFFILKKYRGQGIGQAVAFNLFDRDTGIWQISELPRNYPAQAFWRKVVGRYTSGNFEEEVTEVGDVLQRFTK